MDDYALIDNNLAKSQTDIGESSNLAQIAQTYACNFPDKKYVDYVCILSVIAQLAIDSAKRAFDVDIAEEIRRIKKDMDIKTNKYPSFWATIKMGFNKENINPDLKCPMNYLHNLKLREFKPSHPTLPMTYFFNKFELDCDRRKCRKVEELIQKYSFDLFQYNTSKDKRYEDYLLLRDDFDELIKDIRKTYISSNYLGLISWLIDRCLMITPALRSNTGNINSTISKNRSLLMKVVHDVSPTCFMKCLTKNLS